VREQNGTPVVVDFLSYEVSRADESYGILSPDDPLLRALLPAPTPAALNQTNRAPVLVPLPDREVMAGQHLAFFVSATDPDPGQQLDFSLAGSVPPGAALDAGSGQFTWTPEPADVGTHTITVVVTDDGIPPLHDQKAFRVTARPGATGEVRLIGVTIESPTALRLAWSTTVGGTYQVEHSESVESGWSPVGAPVRARETTTSQTVVVTGPQGFYRIAQVD
jgi:hypothetical protein